jgi:patatin-like phospholipase/acyl hydrolase
MDDKNFKILSIDGGGIKGLYSAIVLNIIEKEYGSIHEHFDLITGTSTGGLIGLGLAKGLTANEIVEFYKKEGNTIFPSSNAISRKLRSFKQVFLGSKYGNDGLRKSIEPIFEDNKLDDSKCCLCIPAVNLSSFQGTVLKTSHAPDLTRDRNVSMVEAALATTAAPTYLPIVSISDISEQIVDGGLWANNPSMIGVFEALRYFVGPEKEYNSISVMSVGNITFHDGWSNKKSKNASLLSWNLKMLELTLTTQSKAVEKMMSIAGQRKLLHINNYIRIENSLPNISHRKLITFDRADKYAINAIADLAQQDGYSIKNKEEIPRFFQSKNRGWNFPIL